MQMLIKKLYIKTNLKDFNQESYYRVLGVEFVNKISQFLVVDDEKKFRILDSSECNFFSFSTEDEDDNFGCDGNCENCEDCEGREDII